MNKHHQLGDWALSVLIPTFLNPHQNFFIFGGICLSALTLKQALEHL